MSEPYSLLGIPARLQHITAIIQQLHCKIQRKLDSETTSSARIRFCLILWLAPAKPRAYTEKAVQPQAFQEGENEDAL